MIRPLLLLAALAAGPAAAQTRQISVSAGAEALSGAYADGQSVVAQGTMPLGRGWLRADAGAISRLGERGVLGAVAVGHDVGRRVVVAGTLAGSTAGFALPRVQAGAGVGLKWGARRAVVTTLGVAHRQARDVHRDTDVTAEVAVYGARALVQTGVRLTRSQPGDATGVGVFGAVTLGRPDARSVTARVAVQREAYLLVEPAPLDVAFRSAEASLAWQEPVGRRWAVTARLSAYLNPYYQQAGVQTGLVHRF